MTNKYKLVSEKFDKFDPRDEEYVPEFKEGPDYDENSDPEYYGEGEEPEQYAIVGTSQWGKEIIDYAQDEDEAQYLVDQYKLSFGTQWEIEYMPENEVDMNEDEFIEDETYLDDDIDNGEEEWNDDENLDENLMESLASQASFDYFDRVLLIIKEKLQLSDKVANNFLDMFEDIAEEGFEDGTEPDITVQNMINTAIDFYAHDVNQLNIYNINPNEYSDSYDSMMMDKLNL